MTGPHKQDDSDVQRTLSLEPHRKRSRYLKHLLLWPAVLLAVVFLLFQWQGGRKGTAVEYRTVKAQRGDLTVTVTATGNLKATNQVDVGTEVSGTVESVAVDYNDVVKAGQVLARLDTTLLEAQVSQSRAAVESARANLRQAEAEVMEARLELIRFTRVRELSGGKIPSQQDFDQAETALKRALANEAMAEANIAQAEAKLRLDQTNLEKAIILSPIDGVVLARTVEPGQTVAASLQAPVLFTLAEDLTKMELHVDVDEADVGQVRDGQQATFTVDAYPNRTYPAHIIQVRFGSQTTDGVVTYPTVLNVDNSDLSLRPGMTATADIVVNQINDALLVPNAALRFVPPAPEEEASVNASGGSLISKLFPRPSRPRQQQRNTGIGAGKAQQVWTLRNSEPVAVPVTIGATSGIMTEIVEGEVAPGMELIIESISRKK
ncbi:MAG: efflux RND transporter periplasmic adaptor subunit [Desulfobulbaceae bacterium]|jgi:HlyD family secretion protein|nr:efflux RND transporter periplasmic adaptor subunit [Desulfobulbaceae bacterium]